MDLKKKFIKLKNSIFGLKFTKTQKHLSNLPMNLLRNSYEDSEQALLTSAKDGDLIKLKENMNIHTDLEYSMLYKEYLDNERD